jgi:hypothetical protein
MYSSRLVPRRATWLGLIGGPLIIVSGTVVMFGGNNPSHALHTLQAILTIPEILWELFLGIYCTYLRCGSGPRSARKAGQARLACRHCEG